MPGRGRPKRASSRFNRGQRVGEARAGELKPYYVAQFRGGGQYWINRATGEIFQRMPDSPNGKERFIFVRKVKN